MKKIIAKVPLPLSDVYQLIEPGPVVMVSTARNGKPNIMTMSWHMMMDFEPPIIACIISNRNYSFDILTETKECVINIPTVDLAEVVVGVGNTTGKRVNKFHRFQLTQVPASRVAVPMIAECFANLECKVIDTRMMAKYNMFILEVLEAWITPHKKRIRTIHHWGNGVFVVDGKQFTLPSNKK